MSSFQDEEKRNSIIVSDASDPEKSLEPVIATQTHDSSNEDPNARPSCFSSTFSEILFVLTATMAIAMNTFQIGGVTVIASYIGEDLNLSNASITWLTAGPSLACGAFLLFFGRIADLFGRKYIYVSSLFLFAVFSLASGFVKSGIALDVLQAFMGLAGAAAVPAAVGSLGSVYKKPSRRKNYAFACFSAGNPLGGVLGSFASGAATQIFSWRANFWLLAIIYGLVALIALFTVPNEKPEQSMAWKTIKQFDIVGTILTIGGIGMISVALTNGEDADKGWKTPYILALLIVGVFLLGVFIWWETKFPAPLMPMWIWRDRDFSLLNIIQAFGSAGFNSAEFWITLFFQRYWTKSPIIVALYLLPMAVMGIIVNVCVAMVLHRISNKLLMGLGFGCYIVSFTLLALNKQSYVYWALCFPSFLIVVWGADTTFNVANIYITSALPRSEQSTAGGIYQCLNRFSNALGLAITTAIFEAVSKSPPQTGYYGKDPAGPYAAVLWACTGMCALGLLFVPFLKIKTQGHSENKS